MIIKNSYVTANIKKIKPLIYGVTIKDDYDRAMVFCCFQEFYESPFPEIKNQEFNLETLMRVYTKKNKKKSFTYPEDWAGYNIPSYSLYKRFDGLYYEYTPYDSIMLEFIKFCEEDSGGTHFYLIGADTFNSDVMDHEIAHGLYYTSKEYKKEMDDLLSTIPKDDYKLMKQELIKIGYDKNKEIIDDEIQAFLSTGLLKTFKKQSIVSLSSKFKKVYEKYK